MAETYRFSLLAYRAEYHPDLPTRTPTPSYRSKAASGASLRSAAVFSLRADRAPARVYALPESPASPNLLPTRE